MLIEKYCQRILANASIVAKPMKRDQALRVCNVECLRVTRDLHNMARCVGYAVRPLFEKELVTEQKVYSRTVVLSLYQHA